MEYSPSEKVDELVTGFFDSRINGTTKDKLLTALNHSILFAKGIESELHTAFLLTDNKEILKSKRYWNTVVLTIQSKIDNL